MVADRRCAAPGRGSERDGSSRREVISMLPAFVTLVKFGAQLCVVGLAIRYR